MAMVSTAEREAAGNTIRRPNALMCLRDNSGEVARCSLALMSTLTGHGRCQPAHAISRLPLHPRSPVHLLALDHEEGGHLGINGPEHDHGEEDGHQTQDALDLLDLGTNGAGHDVSTFWMD